MRIDEILKTRSSGVSFEFFPPKTAEGRESLLRVLNQLEQYSPIYVSVTYGAGGTTRERTKETIFQIKERSDIPIMSHLTCIGATRDSISNILTEYMNNGVDNILALRGDKPQGMEDFDISKGEFRYAEDLVKFIKTFNYFCIAVAVYPEGHQESPSLEADLEYTKMKVDAGADFAITQMFFDNRFFYDFVERAQKRGINIPILPGIMPITDFEKIRKFASFCKATIPVEIEDKFARISGKPEDMVKLGVEIAVKQCEDLIENGVRFLHFYTLNKSDAVTDILASLSLD